MKLITNILWPRSGCCRSRLDRLGGAHCANGPDQPPGDRCRPGCGGACRGAGSACGGEARSTGDAGLRRRLAAVLRPTSTQPSPPCRPC